MEIVLTIIDILFIALMLYKINQHQKQINELKSMQSSIVHDLLLIMREKAIENEDYRKVADIDKILNKK
jgi:hypothetical protein